MLQPSNTDQSNSQAFVEFASPQAATAVKHQIDNLGPARKHSAIYTNPIPNPFRTLPKDAPMRKDNNRGPGGFNAGGNNPNFGMNNMGGGFRGRGGYTNRGNMSNFNNRNNFNPMGGFQGGAAAGGMMGGFQGGPMGGMQNYGYNNRGGMMGGMRGGPGGMRGRGGGNMGMGMSGMNPMGGMGMNPMAGGMNPMMGGMGGNMGMQGESLTDGCSAFLPFVLSISPVSAMCALSNSRLKASKVPTRLSTRVSSTTNKAAVMLHGILMARSEVARSRNPGVDSAGYDFYRSPCRHLPVRVK